MPESSSIYKIFTFSKLRLALTHLDIIKRDFECFSQ